MPLLDQTNNQQQNNSSSSGEEEGEEEEEMGSVGREASPSPCQMAHVNQPGQVKRYQKVLRELVTNSATENFFV
eukprot:3139260-Ditylum_brightwellii.AAC.1